MTTDQIDDNAKNKFIAEHKFLRAMLYFCLVSSWENVPLVLNESQSEDIEILKFLKLLAKMSMKV